MIRADQLPAVALWLRPRALFDVVGTRTMGRARACRPCSRRLPELAGVLTHGYHLGSIAAGMGVAVLREPAHTFWLGTWQRSHICSNFL
jgi:hypothetical protein